MQESFNLPTPSSLFIWLILAILVVAHCGFSVCFPDNIWHLFMCLLAICISFLENYLFRPLPFNWAAFLLMGSIESCLFSDFYSSLYMLNTNSLMFYVVLICSPLWIYSWPLNNTDLNCVGLFILGFFSIHTAIPYDTQLAQSMEAQLWIWRDCKVFMWIFNCTGVGGGGGVTVPNPHVVQ